MRKIQLMKPWITDSEKQAVLDVMDSGWLTEGDKVAEFEEAIAKYVGVNHAIVVPNATIGLELLMDMAVPRNGIVCVPAFSHYATYLAPRRFGFHVSFSDVCTSTGNVSSYSLAESFESPPFDVVVPVSWGGNPLDPDVYAFAADNCITVVEDAACSLGSEDRLGSRTGTGALATVFSFHPRKIISTCEGGAIVTDDDSLNHALRCFKNFGSPYNLHGTNAKLSDVCAAIGVEQLKRIGEIIHMRRIKARFYDELLRDTPFMWHSPNIGFRTYQSYCAYVPHRDRLIHDLAELGIETQIGTHYLPSFNTDDFRNASNLGHHLLTLPLHHEITEDDQEFVVESIVSLLKSYGEHHA